MTTFNTTTLRVHWMRHGKVDSHRGDIPLSDDAREQVEEAGRALVNSLQAGEIVSILHAPTRRTYETATVLYKSIQSEIERAGKEVELLMPAEESAIRNPDIYTAGKRVELVSSAEALLEQLPESGLQREDVEKLPFWHGFWTEKDRIGYWVGHSNPPGEDADTAARRLFTFATSLLELPRTRGRRYICVTHSPMMRAFLKRYLLEYDPGEPEYAELIDMELAEEDWVSIKYRDKEKVITDTLIT